MIEQPFRVPKLLAAALVGLALILGLGLRLNHLDQKIFWVDEVATVIRAAGYTRTELTTTLADGTLHSPADLVAYQQITPNRTLADTVHALSRSPEHAPLYFLLTRFWMQRFGSSAAAIRSLSVLCSLLALPCIYALCREWQLQSRRGCSFGWTAVTLAALSPFWVAYAQEARPYSLWLLAISLTAWTFLRALRLNSRTSWLIYTLALLLSFYTSLLSLLLALGQAIHVWLIRPDARGRLALSLGIALLAFSPWLVLIWQQQDILAANTTWMRTAIQPLSILAIWLYSFAVLFFDVPVVASGWIAVVQALIAAFVLSVMGWALYRLSRSDRHSWAFILVLILPIPLALILFDLIMQGQASATPRYLVPSQLGVLLTVSWWLQASSVPRKGRVQCRQHSVYTLNNSLLSPMGERSVRLLQDWRTKIDTRLIGLVLLSLCLLSGWVNLERSPDYQKARNQANPAIAAQLNQIDQPLLVATADQTMDLLSLSRSLKATVQIQIWPAEQLPAALNRCQPFYLFTPTPALLNQLQPSFQVTEVYKPPLLTDEDVHLSLYWVVRLSC